MAHHRFSPDTADGCLMHARFRPRNMGEWVQGTRVPLASVEQVFRYCRDAVSIQGVSRDQCEESSHAVRHAPFPMPDMPAHHSAA
jgi:hypothetical protein